MIPFPLLALWIFFQDVALGAKPDSRKRRRLWRCGWGLVELFTLSLERFGGEKGRFEVFSVLLERDFRFLFIVITLVKSESESESESEAESGRPSSDSELASDLFLQFLSGCRRHKS